MVRSHSAATFDVWLERVRDSHVRELASFAKSLDRDRRAVLAGLESPYSNGQVEGQVNRLKLIKRSMYGRGSFDLLRKRVLLQ
jgi:transposase